MAFPVESNPRATSSFTVSNFSTTASGDTTAIAGLPNQRIGVHSIALTCASPVDVTFKDGATTLGVYQGVTSLVLDPFVGHSRFAVSAGNSFIVNLSAGVSCKGNIWYVQRAVEG